jgi:hypothetical protein
MKVSHSILSLVRVAEFNEDCFVVSLSSKKPQRGAVMDSSEQLGLSRRDFVVVAAAAAGGVLSFGLSGCGKNANGGQQSTGPTAITERELREQFGITVERETSTTLSYVEGLALGSFTPNNADPGRYLMVRAYNSQVAIPGETIYYSSGVDEQPIMSRTVESVAGGYTNDEWPQLFFGWVDNADSSTRQDISEETLGEANRTQADTVAQLYSSAPFEDAPITFVNDAANASAVLLYTVNYRNTPVENGIRTYPLQVRIWLLDLSTGGLINRARYTALTPLEYGEEGKEQDAWPILSNNVTDYEVSSSTG